MSQRKAVLSIGIDPELIDFSLPEYASIPGLSAEMILNGHQAEQKRFADQNIELDTLLIDLGETAEQVVQAALQKQTYDVVLFGAGLRTMPSNFLLFEKLLNLFHAAAPGAKICFNTRPTDSFDAVQRWL